MARNSDQSSSGSADHLPVAAGAALPQPARPQNRDLVHSQSRQRNRRSLRPARGRSSLRYWKLGIATLVLVGVAGGALTLGRAQPEHRASARVQVQSSRGSDLSDARLQLAQIADQIDTAAFARALFDPEDAAVPALQHTGGIGIDLADPIVASTVAGEFARAHNVTAQIADDLPQVTIHATARDAKSAAALANAYADVVVKLFDAATIGDLDDASELPDPTQIVAELTESLESLAFREEDLTDQIAALDQSRGGRAGDADVLSESGRLRLLEEHEARQRQLVDATTADLAAAEARRRSINQTQASLPAIPTPDNDPALRAARAELADAQAAHSAQLALGKTQQHRDVVLAQERVDRARRTVIARETELRALATLAAAQQDRDGIARQLQVADAEVNAVKNRLAVHREVLAQLIDKVDAARASDAEARLAATAREQLVARRAALIETQRDVRSKLDQARRVVAASSTPKPTLTATVLRPATGADAIASDPRPMWMLVTIATAFVSAIGVMALAPGIRLAWSGASHRRLNEVDDPAGELESKLGGPVLAELPFVAGSRETSLASKLPVCLSTLRATLVSHESGSRVICVVGLAKRDGRSSTALALGRSLARAERRSIVLSLDVIGLPVGVRLGFGESLGLTSVLGDRASLTEVAHRIERDLYFAPAGPIDHLTAGDDGASAVEDYLASSRLYKLINNLTRLFDHVILDVPPAPNSASAAALSAFSDVTVVTCSGAASLGQLRNTADRLTTVGIVPTGIVYRSQNAAPPRPATPSLKRQPQFAAANRPKLPRQPARRPLPTSQNDQSANESP